MNKIRKLFNNFSFSAIRVLGLNNYCLYVSHLIRQSHDIFSKGDLRPLDKAMGRYSIRKFKFRDSTFIFDCTFCDELLLEDSFAFGIVRELYIRDCYFKFLPKNIYEKA